MTNDEAKEFIRRNNPDAFFIDDKFGSFEAYDHTHAGEFRSLIYYFDDIFGALYHSNDEEVLI